MDVKIINQTEATCKGQVFKIKRVVIGTLEDTEEEVIQPLFFKNKIGEMVKCFNFKIGSMHKAKLSGLNEIAILK
jgi:hypothetical protein